jgi:O-antigen/teichoic acid export membrane protein
MTFDLLSKVFLAVSTLAIIRFMSIIEYAKYILAVAIISLMTNTIMPVFNRIYIIGHSRFDIGKNIGPFLGIQLMMLIIAAVLFFPLIRMQGSLYIASLTLASAFCLSDFLKTTYQKLLLFSQFSYIEFARSALYSLSLLSMIAIHGSEIRAGEVLLIQALAMLVVSFPLLLKRGMFDGLYQVGISIRIGMQIIKSEYRYLFGYLFVLAFFSQLDVIMLKILSDAQNLATYGSAFRYYTLLLTALGSVKTVLLPVIQNVSSKKELKVIYRKNSNLMFFIAPLVMVGIVSAEWIIPWIDTGKYPGAIIVFQILAISSLISFVFSPHSTLVMRFERFQFLFLLILMGLGVSFLLNRFMIPLYGAAGTAWATLFSNMLVNLSIFFYSYYLLKVLPEIFPVKNEINNTI